MKKLEEMTQAELVVYARELREESKERRISVEKYDAAFAGLQEGEQKTLLHLVGLFSEDHTRGAERMRELSDAVLKTTSPQTNNNTELVSETIMSDSEETPDANAALLAAITALTEKVDKIEATQTTSVEDAEARDRANTIAQIEALGVKNGTEEFKQFLGFMQMTPDVASANELFQKVNPDFGKPAEEKPAEEVPSFPASAKEGSGGAPTSEEVTGDTGDGFDRSTAQGRIDANTAMMDKLMAEQSATPAA